MITKGLEVARDGCHVLLIMRCVDEYTAMQFYDELRLSADKGFVKLKVVTKPEVPW